MGNKSRRSKKPSRVPKSDSTDRYLDKDDPLDDEIDAFHKQRDVILLDVDADDDGGSDDDMEQPVFDLKESDSDSENGDSIDADGDNEGDSDNGAEKDENGDLPPLAAKIARQAKFLRQRVGMEVDIDEEDEQDEEKRSVWGSYKSTYFGADNANFEMQSSDDELHAEEDEALRLQTERAKSFSLKDFGLKDSDEDDEDNDGKGKNLESIFVVDKSVEKGRADKLSKESENFIAIEKDLGALSKEEQMDIVYSSAPELIGLLSELNETLEQCKETKSFSFKVKENKNSLEGAVRYLEVKQQILFAYSQAIGFYLLLKSEGHSVRDHPVIARLVELRELVQKVKQIDKSVPSEAEILKSLNKDTKSQEQKSTVNEDASFKAKLSNEDALTQVSMIPDLVKVESSRDHGMEDAKISEQNKKVVLQSKEMLKLRASLEEKLKQKGIYNSLKQRSDSSRSHTTHAENRHSDATRDFDDEVTEPAVAKSTLGKLSQLVRTKGKKSMFVSGDDDLPRRDDIGERRRKHELRVLARAGAGYMVDENGMPADENGFSKVHKMDKGLQDDDNEGESEDEFYKEVKRQRVSKLSSKAEKYSRTSIEPSSLPEVEITADGKRLISRQIEKNRGLTRHRKKETKNPRKKYKMKHKKAMVRRKGQVRDIRKPSGPYGGEATGINTGISRSVRFKN